MTGAPGPSMVLLVTVLAPVVASACLWPGSVALLAAVPRSATAGPSPRGRWRSARRVAAVEQDLIELLGVLAGPLRSGVPPSVAVAAASATAAGDTPLGSLLRDLSSAASRGTPLADVWQAQAATDGSAGLSFVARAWALSEQTGAPLADALACAEQVLLARTRARERLASTTAGPKASMAVLCLLPAAGPVVGLVMGIDPMSLYFSSAMGTTCLVLGVALGVGAWAWSRRILRAVA